MIRSDKREKISSVGYPLITRGFPSMAKTACIASIRREPNNLAQASLVNRWSAPSTIHLLGAEKIRGRSGNLSPLSAIAIPGGRQRQLMRFQTFLACQSIPLSLVNLQHRLVYLYKAGNSRQKHVEARGYFTVQ
jgi:hypothetical protein